MAKSVKKAGDKETSPKKKKGNTTKQLMDIHMHDKNHKITSEEIEDLDLDLGHVENTVPSPETILPSKDDRPEEEKKTDDEDLENKKTTPWDILGT